MRKIAFLMILLLVLVSGMVGCRHHHHHQRHYSDYPRYYGSNERGSNSQLSFSNFGQCQKKFELSFDPVRLFLAGFFLQILAKLFTDGQIGFLVETFLGGGFIHHDVKVYYWKGGLEIGLPFLFIYSPFQPTPFNPQRLFQSKIRRYKKQPASLTRSAARPLAPLRLYQGGQSLFIINNLTEQLDRTLRF